MEFDVVKHNEKVWDSEVETGENEWTRPVSPEVIERARRGEFEIVLTPHIPVPRDWFPKDLVGADVLCLASGGGQQAPVLAAAGANVTSFDNSQKQLEQDLLVANREGLVIKTIRGDAADLSAFPDGSFDLIFHPVSNCFMPDVESVWREAARVLKPGGEMLSGFHNGFSYIFDQAKAENDGILEIRHSLPYSTIADLTEEEMSVYLENGYALEYGHTLDQQIGGQIRAGLVITGFFEDYFYDDATPLNKYCPIFAATRARKL